ncbi:group III truncated hemoglobin [Cryomorphaceae bacterium 1068]|nr:group III truncated hemoglobin [Cryomorphaceae bacterium 1068]
MKTLTSREDIANLVHSFYAKIRTDDMLGSVFNRHIAEDEWPAHLSKLTDFWEMKLLGGTNFQGSPTRKHIEVDQASGHTISQDHFAQWLRLWHETIDESFTGALAERAKRQSRKMATGQYIGIWQSRQ